MNFFALVELMRKLNGLLRKLNGDIMKARKFEPERLELEFNPRYTGLPKWGRRTLRMIQKIVVHQEMGNGTTKAVHNYHISEDSHLKLGMGAPKIAYHFTIEKSGKIYQVNDYEDIVWHCAGQNMESIGIMLVGDFDGDGHEGTTSPTIQQLTSLGDLLDFLIDKFDLPKYAVFGHCDFGKKACPGYKVVEYMKEYKRGIKT